MQLQLFNTLTRRKQPFEPMTPGKAGVYTCGPTVYAEAHIGNLRSYVFPDILKKTLRLLGFQVTHVINITDVGHLTSDADTGEDKMEQAARTTSRTAWEIAEEYTRLYLRDLERLHIDIPDTLPRATGHIPEQIDLIRRLEEKGSTYRAEDGIYFDTATFPDYGKLAKLKVEGLQEGARVAHQGKRNKTDFALWKFSPPDTRRQMEWDSPWGKGFPGWHIECSAMSMKYLGEQFDIHTGGTDHIPVHHTNEIAQTEAATGNPFVRVWLHGEYLVLGEDERMGKSEGNFIGLQTLVDKGHEPLTYRYLVLNNHYRKYLNFTFAALNSADHALMGLRKLIKEAGGEQATDQGDTGKPQAPQDQLQETLLADLCDDLNTPKALATLWTTLRDAKISPADKVALAAFAEGILSLGLFDFTRLQTAPQDIPDEVRKLADARWAARQAKDFAEADRLRDLISEKGFTMQDGKDGYTLAEG